jgi:hypothetical protein
LRRLEKEWIESSKHSMRERPSNNSEEDGEEGIDRQGLDSELEREERERENS